MFYNMTRFQMSNSKCMNSLRQVIFSISSGIICFCFMLILIQDPTIQKGTKSLCFYKYKNTNLTKLQSNSFQISSISKNDFRLLRIRITVVSQNIIVHLGVKCFARQNIMDSLTSNMQNEYKDESSYDFLKIFKVLHL